MQKKNSNKILIVGKGNSGKRFKKLLENKYNIIVISSKNFKKELIKVNKKYDLVIISSPSSFHKDHLKSLINSSNKFLIEKPLFSKMSQYRYFYEIDKTKNNKKIFINYNLRETSLYKYLEKFIKKNKNKKLNFVRFYAGQHISMWPTYKKKQNSYSKKFFGGGALLQLCHEIDLALYYFGFPDRHLLIKKQLDKFMDRTDDITVYNFFYKKLNFLLEINVNMLDNHTQRYVELIYRNFTAKFDFFEGTILIFKNNKIVSRKKINNDVIISNLRVAEKILNNQFSRLCSLNEALNQSPFLINSNSKI